MDKYYQYYPYLSRRATYPPFHKEQYGEWRKFDFWHVILYCGGQLNGVNYSR